MAKYVKLEFREQSGLQIIDLVVGNPLQRNLIEPLVGWHAESSRSPSLPCLLTYPSMVRVESNFYYIEAGGEIHERNTTEKFPIDLS